MLLILSTNSFIYWLRVERLARVGREEARTEVGERALLAAAHAAGAQHVAAHAAARREGGRSVVHRGGRARARIVADAPRRGAAARSGRRLASR